MIPPKSSTTSTASSHHSSVGMLLTSNVSKSTSSITEDVYTFMKTIQANFLAKMENPMHNIHNIHDHLNDLDKKQK